MLPLPRPEFLDEDAALDWWEEKVAGFYEQMGATVNAAALTRTIVADLREIRRRTEEATVSLTAAALATGYSADHLARLVKTGKLTNHGRKHAPRVKVSECPRKPAIAATDGQRYNADTDALSLVGSRRLRRIDNAS
jgi:hypothetical protein